MAKVFLKIKKWFKTHNWSAYFLIVLSLFFLFSGGFLIWASNLTMPDFSAFDDRRVINSTKIYDRTGETLLYDVHQDVRRTVVPFDKISRNVKNATVAVEDSEFYEHSGIKPTAILRAAISNIQDRGFSQGGSTITQQVVKNSLLTSDKRISRKLKEWALSVRLENELSKEEILALYLNEIPYGGNVYGIQEASRVFFGKEASDLTIAESAYMASLPNAPTYFSPYGNNTDQLELRKNLVLYEMLNNGFINQNEYEEALDEDVEFLPREDRLIKAPHFVFYIIEQLEERFGRRAIEEEGLKVTTTLDYNMQEKAQEIVTKHALKNEEDFNAENAALVATDPKTGQILTMVGSRGYFDSEIDGNVNVALSARQPGSTFKPFSYAEAFNKGYTPDTSIFDLQTQFSTSCSPDNFSSEGPCYSPVNYDGRFRGPVTMRNALAQSINVPAVKTLYLSDIEDSLKLSKEMGITSLSESGIYGLTLVLGGGEVKLLELTDAYGVFANEGVKNELSGVLKIEDKNNNIIDEYNQNSSRKLKRQSALKISDILSDEEARAPMFGSESPLYFEDRDVAVKTGTTNDFRDAWVVGYTPSLSVGVWVGNNDNTPMERRVSGLVVTPMWREFFKDVLQDYPIENFPEPEDESEDLDLKPVLRGIWRGGDSYLIDSISGKLATEYTPDETIEELIVDNVQSILYWLDKDNPRGPRPENPENDGQFSLWNYPVRLWAQQQNLNEGDDSQIPTEEDDVHLPEFFPEVSFNLDDNNVGVNQSFDLSIDVLTEFPFQKAELFFNGHFIGSKENENDLNFSFQPSDFGLSSGQSGEIMVVVYDQVHNKTEETLTINIVED